MLFVLVIGGLFQSGCASIPDDPDHVQLAPEHPGATAGRASKRRVRPRSSQAVALIKRGLRPTPRGGSFDILELTRCKSQSGARKSKFLRGLSSVGRAPQWHCGGQGFESPRLQSSLAVAAERRLSRRSLGEGGPAGSHIAFGGQLRLGRTILNRIEIGPRRNKEPPSGTIAPPPRPR